jgi:cellulose biosynthesis protein BcsQ
MSDGFGLGQSGKKILLADFDMTSGSVAFFRRSARVFFCWMREGNGRLGPAGLVVAGGQRPGIDVLAAPDSVQRGSRSDRLHDALESAREVYDWIIVDLPSIFEK